MKIHEYQAKEILRRYGVAMPRGKVIDRSGRSPGDREELGGKGVVKAQIHAGGRGKGGGVKLAKSPDEAVEVAKQILGMKLVTQQTGPEGRMVRKVLVEEAADIARELYLGVTLDRAVGRPVLMASKFGGMEIEEVAAKNPEAILEERSTRRSGCCRSRRASSRFGLGLTGDAARRPPSS